MKIKFLILFCLVFSFSCGPSASESQETAEKESMVDFPLIKLTQGPKQHWFGYYDKLQIDPRGKYALAAEVDPFRRSPTATDTLRIGLIDLQTRQWESLGTSTAWGWQQGCMLQWIPGSAEEIIWNDFEDGQFVSRVLNVKTKQLRTLPKAIYTLSNNGKFAIGTEFSRIQNMRPGYGYPGQDDPYAETKAPSEIGIYKMDLMTGEHELLISIAEMAAESNLGEDLSNYWHYFNHLLISPDDQRFIFLHRWRKVLGDRTARASSGFTTRMVTANLDGSDRYILDPSGHTSHFIWRNPTEVCMWTKPVGKEWGFYLFKDQTAEVIAVGEEVMTMNGHNTYLPNTEGDWILNDTYPQGEERLQELYLYQVSTNRKISLGKFHEPKAFKGEWRCDLHPKTSTEGRYVIFDSTHEGDGRQIYAIDISSINTVNQ